MKIHHTALTVHSLKESIDFYTEMFRLRVEKEFDSTRFSCKIAVLKDEGTGRLELFEFKDSKKFNPESSIFEQEGIIHIAFEVSDIYEEEKRFKDKGYVVDIKMGTTVKYFFINDPTGIKIEVYEPGK